MIKRERPVRIGSALRESGSCGWLGDREDGVVIETALLMPGQFKAGKLNSQIQQEDRGRSLEKAGLEKGRRNKRKGTRLYTRIPGG